MIMSWDNEGMDGYMDGWIHGWMDGWTIEQDQGFIMNLTLRAQYHLPDCRRGHSPSSACMYLVLLLLIHHSHRELLQFVREERIGEVRGCRNWGGKCVSGEKGRKRNGGINAWMHG